MAWKELAGRLAEWPGIGGDMGPRTPLAASVAKTVGLSGAENILPHSAGMVRSELARSACPIALRGIMKWELGWICARGALVAQGED